MSRSRSCLALCISASLTLSLTLSCCSHSVAPSLFFFQSPTLRCDNCRQGKTGICLNVNPARPGAAYGYGLPTPHHTLTLSSFASLSFVCVEDGAWDVAHTAVDMGGWIGGQADYVMVPYGRRKEKKFNPFFFGCLFSRLEGWWRGLPGWLIAHSGLQSAEVPRQDAGPEEDQGSHAALGHLPDWCAALPLIITRTTLPL